MILRRWVFVRVESALRLIDLRHRDRVVARQRARRLLAWGQNTSSRVKWPPLSVLPCAGLAVARVALGMKNHRRAIHRLVLVKHRA